MDLRFGFGLHHSDYIGRPKPTELAVYSVWDRRNRGIRADLLVDGSISGIEVIQERRLPHEKSSKMPRPPSDRWAQIVFRLCWHCYPIPIRA